MASSSFSILPIAFLKLRPPLPNLSLSPLLILLSPRDNSCPTLYAKVGITEQKRNNVRRGATEAENVRSCGKGAMRSRFCGLALPASS